MSSIKEEFDKLAKAIVSGDVEGCKRVTEDLMKCGVAFKDVIVEGVMRGVSRSVELLDAGEITLFELIDCVKAIHAILNTLEKLIKKPEVPLGKIIIGVVEGDTHAIGKDIVAAMLSYSGFEVHNLGDKVPPSIFVEKAKEVNTDIVALKDG